LLVFPACQGGAEPEQEPDRSPAAKNTFGVVEKKHPQIGWFIK
jgi:hypothetical protein